MVNCSIYDYILNT